MTDHPDRSLPPGPVRLANEDGSSVFINTDGTIYRKYYDPEGRGYGSHPLDTEQAEQYRNQARTAERIAQAWEYHDQAQERFEQREALVQKACTDLAQASRAGLDPEQLRTSLRSNAGIELGDGAHLELRTPNQKPQWLHIESDTGARRETHVTAEHATALLDGQTLAELGYRAGSRKGKVRAVLRTIERAIGVDGP